MLSHILARQVINNTLFILDVVLAVFLVLYIIKEGRKRGWAEAYERLGVQAAMAVLVLQIGHIVLRGWSAVLLWYYANGRDALQIENKYPVALVGAILCVIGMLCCIRIFSRERWGHWGWVFAIVFGILFVIGVQAISFVYGPAVLAREVLQQIREAVQP